MFCKTLGARFMSAMASNSYKPVVLVHGVLAGAPSLEYLKEKIEIAHLGTNVTIFDRYNGIQSIERAWDQVNGLAKDLKRICEENPDGIHLLGFSQGGLIARALLQVYPHHNVKTFISLSSPQAGQYGLEIATEHLHKYVPVDLVTKDAYEFLYTHAGQKISIANYWKDPTQLDLYLRYNEFLPYLNNELPTKESFNYRKGIVKLEKMILIGGPDDGIITPWQSAHFEFYDETKKIEALKQNWLYKDDMIGLRELDSSGRLIVHSKSNVAHHEWHENDHVINEMIIPHLD